MFAQINLEDEKNQIKGLQTESYENLETKYQKTDRMDSVTRLKYARAYLLKAKKENDTIKKITGYEMLGRSSSSDVALLILDSIIDFTKKSTNFKYPARAYLHKVNILGHASKYSEQMKQLKQANVYANARNNIDQQYEIKYSISLLKVNLEEYEESKAILRELIPYYEKKHTINERYNLLYNKTLFAYGNVLNSLKQLDSAEIINKKAIRLILKSKDSLLYDRLLLSSAVTHYLKKEYEPSLDSIKKFQNNYTRQTSSLGMIVAANVYLSKIYLKLNNEQLAEKYLLKSDSIIFSENYFFPDFRENNELLVQFYKDKKDVKKQLYYINRLLVIDSILDKNNIYLAKHINSDYTTPNLILEKQKIIKSLKKNDANKKIAVIILLFLCASLIIVLVRNNKKKKLYKKRIQEFGTKKKERSYVIDDETTKRILDELFIIEQSELFLNPDFNLGQLAKLLKTNTSYLSRIINEHKKLTFKQYLIDLRINVLIKKMDQNPIIRKHSIEALAESIGYTNASSFTRIFKNYTGISPSEYLKKRYSK